MNARAAGLLLSLCTAAGACRSTEAGPYSAPSADSRDGLKAAKLSREAADLVAADPEKAERLLREALTADLFHGPAHNNLGVVYLKHGKLYEAANEFEWARKLMPGDPEPRLNLALTLERAGHTEEAQATFKTALEVAPEHMPTIEALTALQVKSGKRDDEILARLKLISYRGETEAWRRWGRDQLARCGRP